MVPHGSYSSRIVPILGLALVLAAALLSCGRGADTPPAGSRVAADTDGSGTRARADATATAA